MNRKTTKKEYKISGVPFSVYLHNSSSPTILYIHTYNSNRTEVRTILNHALKKGFNVVSVEVQRVGFTEEKEPKVDPKGIITFGYFEYEQIRVVMEWIKAKINCEVIIWGRSMGAVCAVRYQHRYGDAC
jgi:predicted alpha/beta-fold hydrolase